MEPNQDPPAPSGRPLEVDVDRGYFFGLVLGAAMFFLFQGFILAAFQTPVISSDLPLLQPLKFSGVSQLIYVFPSVLFFVNRKCPKMAYGFLTAAAIVFVGAGISLIVS